MVWTRFSHSFSDLRDEFNRFVEKKVIGDVLSSAKCQSVKCGNYDSRIRTKVSIFIEHVIWIISIS